MIKTILLILLAAVVVLLIVIALQPSHYHVSRSEVVSAAPATVFAEVDDLRRWRSWSPWENLDPALQRTYSGAEAGEGARYAWVGNSKTGEGRMTIIESRPAERIRLKLEFFKPMPGLAEAIFTFEPRGDQTTITWSMSGESGFLHKAMGLFVSMDKLLGPTFEQGLAALKKLSEEKSRATVAAGS